MVAGQLPNYCEISTRAIRVNLSLKEMVHYPMDTKQWKQQVTPADLFKSPFVVAGCTYARLVLYYLAISPPQLALPRFGK